MKLYISVLATIATGLISVFTWAEDPISYSRDIKKILSNNCFECHGPDSQARKKTPRLDVAEEAYAKTTGGITPIVPGNPEASEIIKLITSDDPDLMMPPPDSGKQLTEKEIELIRQWLKEGAQYQAHWSYVAPKQVTLPFVSDKGWVTNPIDQFILARLEQEKLTTSVEADRRTLIRRVSLDLIGIPPTPEEIDDFVNDKRSGAYARVVERLLNSPAYGERWAGMWLDLARYADTKGYEADRARVIWKYRDWVIKALNDDMPYTQFTIEQLAGDLLENPTEDQITATAFHRNTMNNDEGGTDAEEFRTAAVLDRVITTMQVWMGTTMMCAQCHDHKYDPISTKEFYRFYDYFNQTEDNDNNDESPTYWHATQEQKDQIEKFQKVVNTSNNIIKKLDESLKTAKEEEKFALKKEKQAALIRRDFVKPQLDKIMAATVRTPVMVELPDDKKRTSHILIRGSFLAPGEVVTTGTPEVFHPFPEDAPQNRLGVAQWLMSEDNPLVARVTVNRYWEQFFGAGLVGTSEEFGAQGDLPTHPELLDWMAVDFMKQGWNFKDLCRTMVMSSTYRQASNVSSEMLEKDPANELYARGPRFRLGAEQVRDQALAISGLLSKKMYGPSVKPYQPDGVWKIVYNGDQWTKSEGEDAHRRALYTFIRRTTPYPSMLTFDATSREVCTIRRIRTNTPLQALVTLNDPVYVEAAQAMARRILKESSESTLDARIQFAINLALGRIGSEPEIDYISHLYTQALDTYKADTDKAVALSSSLVRPVPEGLHADELAAWTVVSNTLMNVDEFLTKR